MTDTRESTSAGAPGAYIDVATQRVTAGNGIEYAYRDVGEGDVPLILLQHFRGNLDNWDPALIDALAANRRVVPFDNVGVGPPPAQRRTPSKRWPTMRLPSGAVSRPPLRAVSSFSASRSSI